VSRSHIHAQNPTFLLALIALGIVSRFHPHWLAIELKTAAAEHDVSPQRLSRLVSRALTVFEPLVATLTRRGRPPRERDDAATTELAITRALLAVATEVLSRITLRGWRVRELVVGAFERLRSEHAISQKRFCEALSLSPRTLRHWLTQPRRGPHQPDNGRSACPGCGSQPSGDSKPDPNATCGPSARPRPPRRGRFGFDVLLPGTQVGADTTDISAFGVSLKLIAAQDIGGRDESLFDAVLVDDHESAELVVEVLNKVLADKPGAQAITDQGTPYMAHDTSDALEQLGVEHAPQREADPLGKATVERALGTVKHIAAPLCTITNRIAEACPELREPTLAKAITTLVITALLRAYQHGARAARAALDARGNIDPDELASLAEASRQRARATESSAKLLLQHLHAAYRLAGNITHFVRSFRRYPLTVLHDADRALRRRIVRDDLEPVRDPWRYFGAIVRNLHDEHRRDRARHRRIEQQNREHDHRHQEHATRIATFKADPLAWLRYGLELLAAQWLPAASTLLCGGEGYGLGNVRAALRCLLDRNPHAARDLTHGALHDFRLATAERLGSSGMAAITTIVERELAKLGTNHDCAPPPASDILTRTGKTPRPPPSGHLPI